MTRTELFKIAKPRIHTTDEVRAMINRDKTCHRTVIKQIPTTYHGVYTSGENEGNPRPLMDWPLSGVYERNGEYYLDVQTDVDDAITTKLKFKTKVGDIVYVREAWSFEPCSSCGGNCDTKPPDFYNGANGCFCYKANYTDTQLKYDESTDEIYSDFPACIIWNSPATMPKEAARIFYEIKAQRVERLQDITLEQVYKEGILSLRCEDCKNGICKNSGQMSCYETYWNSRHKNKSEQWDANPWVLVEEFELVEVDE